MNFGFIKYKQPKGKLVGIEQEINLAGNKTKNGGFKKLPFSIK
jgi:hypothetical protein